jgi:hypothetical protein
MYACMPEIGGRFFKGVCTPSNATAYSYDPPQPPTQRPEPHCQGSGSKWITRRSTVDGALAWGRGKPPPERCSGTAPKPPRHRGAFQSTKREMRFRALLSERGSELSLTTV